MNKLLIVQLALVAGESMRGPPGARNHKEFRSFIDHCAAEQKTEDAISLVGMGRSQFPDLRRDAKLKYYRDFYCALRFTSKRAKTVLDVNMGTSDAPLFLLSLPNVESREIVAPDLHALSEETRRECQLGKHCVMENGLNVSLADFATWVPSKSYDVVLCNQVLEHVDNPHGFLKKLMRVGKTVVVSVPLEWRDKGVLPHKHHNIDIDRVREWAGEQEIYHFVSKEPVGKFRNRMIMIFRGAEEQSSDLSSMSWHNFFLEILKHVYTAVRRPLGSGLKQLKK